jgi:hypothetical protein
MITGRYEYDRGNVIKHHQKKEYMYDPDVVKEVPMYASGSEYTWVYSNGQLVDFTERTGGTDTHPLTIQNGLIFKAAYPEGFILYEYDSQDRLTKMSLYNNALNSYYTQEWADGQPAAAALPRFKGFPQIKLPGGKVGVLQKFKYYAGVEGKGVKLLNESTNAVQYNARGFVTSITSTQRNLIDYFNGSEYTETASPAPLLITYDCK